MIAAARIRANIRSKPRAAAIAFALLAAGCSSGQVDKATRSFETSAPAVLDDASIVAQVEARLIGIDADSALHVGVKSNNGTVRLSGSVKSAQVSQRFTDAAKGISGVKRVDASLHVDSHLPPVSGQAKDALTVTAVTGSLLGQTGLNAVGIKVDARDGAVTLSGNVKTPALKSTMYEAAKHTSGVKSVTNNLRVQ